MFKLFVLYLKHNVTSVFLYKVCKVCLYVTHYMCFIAESSDVEQMDTENVCPMNRQHAGNDLSRTLSKQLQSRLSSEDLLTYNEFLTPFSEWNTISVEKKEEVRGNCENPSKNFIFPESSKLKYT